MKNKNSDYEIIRKKPSILWVNKYNLNNSWMTAEYYKPKYIDIEEKIKKFKVKKFKEIANIDRVTGFQVQKYLKIVENGIPYLRVSNVLDCFLDYNDMQYIPEEVHNEFNKSQFKRNDIALTITGRVGSAAIINTNDGFNACQDVVKISIKEKENLDPYYLTLYLNSSYSYHLLTRFNSGGSRPRTLIGNVREVKIPIPSKNIQKYIGDKIKDAEGLREKAKNLKKEAFNYLNDYISSFILKDDEQIINLTVNKGYNVIKKDPSAVWVNTNNIEDRLDSKYYHYEYLKLEAKKFKMQKHLSQCLDYFETGLNNFKSDEIPVKRLKTKNIQNENVLKKDLLDVEINNRHIDKILKKGDVVLTTYGTGSLGKLAYIYEDTNWVPDYTIAILRVKDFIDPAFLMTFLSSEYGQIQIMRRVNGTTGITFVLKSQLESLKIPVISKKIQKEIGDKIRGYYRNLNRSKQLIQEAKQDVEDLIEGNFTMKDR